uniref:Microtubule-associated protein n=1 Tax=Eptatretus burgeri TaxID=7764 RepID=A0A8C4NAU6_EPTBU
MTDPEEHHYATMSVGVQENKSLAHLPEKHEKILQEQTDSKTNADATILESTNSSTKICQQHDDTSFLQGGVQEVQDEDVAARESSDLPCGNLDLKPSQWQSTLGANIKQDESANFDSGGEAIAHQTIERDPEDNKASEAWEEPCQDYDESKTECKIIMQDVRTTVETSLENSDNDNDLSPRRNFSENIHAELLPMTQTSMANVSKDFPVVQEHIADAKVAEKDSSPSSLQDPNGDCDQSKDLSKPKVIGIDSGITSMKEESNGHFYEKMLDKERVSSISLEEAAVERSINIAELASVPDSSGQQCSWQTEVCDSEIQRVEDNLEPHKKDPKLMQEVILEENILCKGTGGEKEVFGVKKMDPNGKEDTSNQAEEICALEHMLEKEDKYSDSEYKQRESTLTDILFSGLEAKSSIPNDTINAKREHDKFEESGMSIQEEFTLQVCRRSSVEENFVQKLSPATSKEALEDSRYLLTKSSGLSQDSTEVSAVETQHDDHETTKTKEEAFSRDTYGEGFHDELSIEAKVDGNLDFRYAEGPVDFQGKDQAKQTMLSISDQKSPLQQKTRQEGDDEKSIESTLLEHQPLTKETAIKGTFPSRPMEAQGECEYLSVSREAACSLSHDVPEILELSPKAHKSISAKHRPPDNEAGEVHDDDMMKCAHENMIKISAESQECSQEEAKIRQQPADELVERQINNNNNKPGSIIPVPPAVSDIKQEDEEEGEEKQEEGEDKKEEFMEEEVECDVEKKEAHNAIKTPNKEEDFKNIIPVTDKKLNYDCQNPVYFQEKTSGASQEENVKFSKLPIETTEYLKMQECKGTDPQCTPALSSIKLNYVPVYGRTVTQEQEESAAAAAAVDVKPEKDCFPLEEKQDGTVSGEHSVMEGDEPTQPVPSMSSSVKNVTDNDHCLEWKSMETTSGENITRTDEKKIKKDTCLGTDLLNFGKTKEALLSENLSTSKSSICKEQETHCAVEQMKSENLAVNAKQAGVEEPNYVFREIKPYNAKEIVLGSISPEPKDQAEEMVDILDNAVKLYERVSDSQNKDVQSVAADSDQLWCKKDREKEQDHHLQLDKKAKPNKDIPHMKQMIGASILPTDLYIEEHSFEDAAVEIDQGIKVCAESSESDAMYNDSQNGDISGEELEARDIQEDLDQQAVGTTELEERAIQEDLDQEAISTTELEERDIQEDLDQEAVGTTELEERDIQEDLDQEAVGTTELEERDVQENLGQQAVGTTEVVESVIMIEEDIITVIQTTTVEMDELTGNEADVSMCDILDIPTDSVEGLGDDDITSAQIAVEDITESDQLMFEPSEDTSSTPDLTSTDVSHSGLGSAGPPMRESRFAYETEVVRVPSDHWEPTAVVSREPKKAVKILEEPCTITDINEGRAEESGMVTKHQRRRNADRRVETMTRDPPQPRRRAHREPSRYSTIGQASAQQPPPRWRQKVNKGSFSEPETSAKEEITPSPKARSRSPMRRLVASFVPRAPTPHRPPGIRVEAKDKRAFIPATRYPSAPEICNSTGRTFSTERRGRTSSSTSRALSVSTPGNLPLVSQKNASTPVKKMVAVIRNSRSPSTPRTSTQPVAMCLPDLTNIKPKVMSTVNIRHQPGGGKVHIHTKKADYTHVTSKCGSKYNIHHKPGGGKVKIETSKLEFREKAKPKVYSRHGGEYMPGGGNVKRSKGITSGNRGSQRTATPCPYIYLGSRF